MLYFDIKSIKLILFVLNKYFWKLFNLIKYLSLYINF